MSASTRTIRRLQEQLADAKFRLDIYAQWKEPLPEDLKMFVEADLTRRLRLGGRIEPKRLSELIRDAVELFEKQRLESQT